MFIGRGYFSVAKTLYKNYIIDRMGLACKLFRMAKIGPTEMRSATFISVELLFRRADLNSEKILTKN